MWPRASRNTTPSQTEGTVAELDLSFQILPSCIFPGCFYPAEPACDAHAGRRRGSQWLSVAGQWLSDGQVKGRNILKFKQHFPFPTFVFLKIKINISFRSTLIDIDDLCILACENDYFFFYYYQFCNDIN